MLQEKEAKCLTYEKAAAEIVYFDNSDVITTSGGGGTGGGCLNWSNQNGVSCYYGLSAVY